MIKNNKLKMIITSVATMLPAVVTLVFWDKLSEKLEEKYLSGANDMLRGFIVFPTVLLVLQWVFALISSLDPKSNEQNKKIINIVLWIMPLLSVFVYMMMLNSIVQDGELMEMLISPMFGILMIVIGNYMPKTTRNSFMGIKIKWTLANDENWNATHRFSGKLQVVCGIIICFGAFLPIWWQLGLLLAVVFLGMAIPTTVYSYLYYKKQVANGTYVDNEQPLPAYAKKYGVVSIVIVSLILVACSVIMFVGSIETSVGDTALDIKASFGDDVSVLYEEIDSIEYREEKDVGVRVMGFNSLRLSIGNFKNDELGSYVCYVYNATENCIILKIDGKALMINTADEESTIALYEQLLSKIGS